MRVRPALIFKNKSSVYFMWIKELSYQVGRELFTYLLVSLFVSVCLKAFSVSMVVARYKCFFCFFAFLFWGVWIVD